MKPSLVWYLFLTLKDPESVLCVKLLAAIGSTPGEVPPHIIDIEAVGAIAVLLENLSYGEVNSEDFKYEVLSFSES